MTTANLVIKVDSKEVNTGTKALEALAKQAGLTEKAVSEIVKKKATDGLQSISGLSGGATNSLKSITKSITQLESNFGKLITKLNSFVESINKLNTKSMEASTSLRNTRTSINDVSRGLGSMSNALDRAANNMGELGNAAGLARDNTRTMNTEITRLKREIARLRDVSIGAAGGLRDLGTANATIERLKREMAELRAELDRVRNAADRTQRELDQIRDQSGRAANNTRGLGGAFRFLTSAALGFIGLHSAQALMEVADEAIQVRNRLKVVTQGNEELNATFDGLAKASERSWVSLRETSNLYQRMAIGTKDMGISSKELIRVTETINKSFQLSGATAFEAAGAIRQLTQAFNGNMLRGEEFNSVTEQAPIILKAIEKETGLAGMALREFASQGGISSEILINALTNAQDEIDTLFDKTQKTSEVALADIRRDFVLWADENENLNGTIGMVIKGLDSMAGGVRSIIDSFATFTMETAKLSEALLELPAVGEFISISELQEAASITKELGGNLTFGQEVLVGFDEVMTRITSMISLTDILAEAFKRLRSILPDTAAGIEELSSAYAKNLLRLKELDELRRSDKGFFTRTDNKKVVQEMLDLMRTVDGYEKKLKELGVTTTKEAKSTELLLDAHGKLEESYLSRIAAGEKLIASGSLVSSVEASVREEVSRLKTEVDNLREESEKLVASRLGLSKATTELTAREKLLRQVAAQSATESRQNDRAGDHRKKLISDTIEGLVEEAQAYMQGADAVEEFKGAKHAEMLIRKIETKLIEKNGKLSEEERTGIRATVKEVMRLKSNYEEKQEALKKLNSEKERAVEKTQNVIKALEKEVEVTAMQVEAFGESERQVMLLNKLYEANTDLTTENGQQIARLVDQIMDNKDALGQLEAAEKKVNKEREKSISLAQKLKEEAIEATEAQADALEELLAMIDPEGAKAKKLEKDFLDKEMVAKVALDMGDIDKPQFDAIMKDLERVKKGIPTIAQEAEKSAQLIQSTFSDVFKTLGDEIGGLGDLLGSLGDVIGKDIAGALGSITKGGGLTGILSGDFSGLGSLMTPEFGMKAGAGLGAFFGGREGKRDAARNSQLGSQLGMLAGSVLGPIGGFVGSLLGGVGGGFLGPKESDKTQTGIIDLFSGRQFSRGMGGEKFSSENLQAATGATDVFKAVLDELAEDMNNKLKGQLEFVVGSRDGIRVMFDGKELINAKEKAEALDFATKFLVEMAGVASDVFESLRLEGETFSEAYLRLENQLDVVRMVSEALGSEFTLIGEDALKAADTMASMSGGIEAFTANAQFFINAFTSNADKFGKLTSDLDKSMADLGVSLPATREGFKELVEAQDLNTEAGERLTTGLMELAPSADAFYEHLDSLRRMEIDLLKLQGKEHEALALTRQMTLEGLTAEQAAKQEAIFVQEDLNKVKDIETQLMKLQGIEGQTVAKSRETELEQLRLMDAALGTNSAQMQQQIWDIEQANKVRDLDIELLNLQGKSMEALALTREKELEGLEGEELAKRQAIHTQEDLNKVKDLENQLLTLQGKESVAVAEAREKELEQLRLMDEALGTNAEQMQKQIWALEKLNEAEQALLKSREEQASFALSLGDPVSGRGASGIDQGVISAEDRALMQQSLIDLGLAAKDTSNSIAELVDTRSLEIKLLELQGRSQEALAISRGMELEGKSAEEKKLIRLIHAQEDLNAARDAQLRLDDLQIRLLQVQGKEEEALAMIRAKELAAVSEAERAILEQIFAQEDLNKLNADGAAQAGQTAAEIQAQLDAIFTDFQTRVDRFNLSPLDLALAQLGDQINAAIAQVEELGGGERELAAIRQFSTMETARLRQEEADRLAAIEAERAANLKSLMDEVGESFLTMNMDELDLEFFNLRKAMSQTLATAEELGATEQQLADIRMVSELQQQRLRDAAQARLAEFMLGITDQIDTFNFSDFEKSLFDLDKQLQENINTATALRASEADLDLIRQLGELQKQRLIEEENARNAAEELARMNAELEELADKLRGLAQDAFDRLERSVSAEKDRLQADFDRDIEAINARYDGIINSLGSQLDVVNERVSKLSKVAGELANAVEATSKQTTLLERQQARARLTSVLDMVRSGADLAGFDISDDIARLSEDSAGLFGDFADFAFEQAASRVALANLSKEADSQLSAAEQQVVLLEQQIEQAKMQQDLEIALRTEQYEGEISRLDSILQNAQAQLDKLNGIDNSILSLGDALNGFQSTIGNAMAGIASQNAANMNAMAARIEMQNSIGAVAPDLISGSKNTPTFSETFTLPGFAHGTGSTPSGHYLVGENGPEIMSTPGAKITNNEELAEMLNNTEALQAIQTEIRNGNVQLIKYTKRSYEVLDDWDNVGMPPVRT